MSLRLGGPARGFVLITSRRESERGEVHGGEEELSLSSLFSNFLSLFPHIPFFVPPPLCLSLSFSLFSLFYHSDRREGRRPRTSLKSKSRRKGRREKNREENRTQDNSKLSHGPTQDGVRATLFRRRTWHAIANSLPLRLTVHFLRARFCALRFKMAHIIFIVGYCVYVRKLYYKRRVFSH